MTNTHITIGGHKVSAGKVYSTSEVRTGDVWTNGNPVFRKVFEIQSSSFSKSTSGSRVTYSYSTTLDDQIRILNVGGWIRYADSNLGSIIVPFGQTSVTVSLGVGSSAFVSYNLTTRLLTISFAFDSALDNRYSMEAASSVILEYIKLNA